MIHELAATPKYKLEDHTDNSYTLYVDDDPRFYIQRHKMARGIKSAGSFFHFALYDRRTKKDRVFRTGQTKGEAVKLAKRIVERELRKGETAATPILYHITGCFSLEGILKRDRFELKPAEGTITEEKLNVKAAYYLSTTRSKIGAYTRNSMFSFSCVIVLDGNKLGQKYKIIPVDYWQMEGVSLEMQSKRDEMEDRILCPTPFLPNATKYIKELHVFWKEDKQPQMFNIKKIALLHKIPVYFYNHDQYPKALLSLDKTKSFKPQFTNVLPPAEEPRAYQYKYSLRKNSIFPWLELYFKKPYEADPYKRGKELNEKAEIIRVHLYNRDTVSSLNADLHNAKSIPYDHVSKEREALDKLVGVLRKNKWTPQQFINAMYEKWKSPPMKATSRLRATSQYNWEELMRLFGIPELTEEQKEHIRQENEHNEAHKKTGFWGKQGAGCIFMARDTKRVLLPLRSMHVEQPYTWGTWGGAIDNTETPEHAVRREVKEEAGYTGKFTVIPLSVFKKGDFQYHNFLAIVEKEFKPVLNWETSKAMWFPYRKFPPNLHPGLKVMLHDSDAKIRHVMSQLDIGK